jgi:hypothetical protein
MKQPLFDDITRILGEPIPRREALKLAFAAWVAAIWPREALAASAPCTRGNCSDPAAVDCGGIQCCCLTGQICCGTAIANEICCVAPTTGCCIVAATPQCVNFATDCKNCGTCGTVCPTGNCCIGGVCTILKAARHRVLELPMALKCCTKGAKQDNTDGGKAGRRNHACPHFH